MKENIENLNKWTDLAVEAKDMAVKRTGGEVNGITVNEVEIENGKVTRIEVLNPQAGQQIGKAPGNYITIESEQLRSADINTQEYLSGVLADELNQLIDYSVLTNNLGEPTILVIGLGNWNATPDALGPQVIHHLLITRHLYDSAPLESRQGMRSVCALSPGVLGLTGIETAEIIRGVVDRVKPDLIIAIDALAARESNRLASTIQISDTGIYPGSGLGKHRIGVTQKDMGVPVVAIGIPTVINSVNIVNDTIEQMLNNNNLSPEVRNALGQSNNHKQIVQQILKPFLGDLIVSPKGIDRLIRDTSKVIAGGLNIALHPDIKVEDVSLYLQ